MLNRTPLDVRQALRARLTEDLIDEIPPYTIHLYTWGADNDEMTFDDVRTGKTGYEKV